MLFFKLMALMTLGIVFLVLFTTAFPTGSIKQKPFYAMSGLAVSVFLMFIAPTLYY